MCNKTSFDGPCDCGCHDADSPAMHIAPCCFYTSIPRAEAEAAARQARERHGSDRTDQPQKFSLGQRVLVVGWVESAVGVVRDIKRIFHQRIEEWVWGYQIDYENSKPVLSLKYVPQGYLREISETSGSNMMHFGIFKLSVTYADGCPVISYSALKSPVGSDPIKIEAISAEEAVDKATDLLRQLGVETHSILGDPDTIMAPFPNFFVGEVQLQVADKYDTRQLEYRISQFFPVHASK